MIVKLSHCMNFDISGGGYWEPPLDSGKARWVKVASFKEASDVCRTFIERNGLGGGNWSGGEVRDDSGYHSKVVGSVSYNGRVWGPHSDEITL